MFFVQPVSSQNGRMSLFFYDQRFKKSVIHSGFRSISGHFFFRRQKSRNNWIVASRLHYPESGRFDLQCNELERGITRKVLWQFGRQTPVPVRAPSSSITSKCGNRSQPPRHWVIARSWPRSIERSRRCLSRRISDGKILTVNLSLANGNETETIFWAVW